MAGIYIRRKLKDMEVSNGKEVKSKVSIQPFSMPFVLRGVCMHSSFHPHERTHVQGILKKRLFFFDL